MSCRRWHHLFAWQYWPGRHGRAHARWRVSHCIAYVAICLLWAVGDASAQSALPEHDALTTRLDRLQSLEQPNSEQRAAIDDTRAALEALKELDTVDAKLDALEQRAENAPQESKSLTQDLQRLEQASASPSERDLGDLSLDALRERTGDALEQLETLQSRLADVNAQLISAQTLPERAQTAIAEARERADTRQSQLADLDDVEESNEVELAKRDRYRVEQALAERRAQWHQSELSHNTRLRELAMQQRDVLEKRIALQEDQLSALQSALDRERREQSEKAIADVGREDAEAIASHPVLTKVQQVNRDLSGELLEVTDRANDLVREGIETRTQLDRVRQVQRTLNEQIDAIRGSLLLSRILREQRESLPEVDELGGLQDEIADLRLRQFDLSQQRDVLRRPQQLADKSLAEADIDDAPGLREALIKLFESRRKLLDQLDEEYGNLLTIAINQQLNQQQLLEISGALRATIEEQLFWVANGRPLDLTWLQQFPRTLWQAMMQGDWRSALVSAWQRPDAEAFAMLPLLLLSAVLLLLRRRIKASLLRLHEEVGRLKRDTQMHTPRAIALNALLAAHGPLSLAAIGGVLNLGGHGFAVMLGAALLQLALAWGVVAWSRRLLVADGVAARHFHWSPQYVLRLRHLLLWLGIALIPVILISNVAPYSDVRLAERPLSLLLLLLGLVTMTVVLVRLILAHVPFFGLKLFRLLLGLALSVVPLILAGLIVMGFEYTALSLVGRFITSLYILGLWILVEAAVVRGLAVAARRLAYRRAVARRRAQAKEDTESGLEVVEEPPLDMEQVNQQSLRLSKLILFLGFTLVLYVVWADLLSVLSYLDNVTVWQIERGQGEAMTTSPITVADVLTALVLVALTLMMARNLPGLLEVMVLSRLSLKQGSAYAISSLLSYTIVGTGVVVSLGTLGVSWDKLQWLVAALGVGLGFGLQEIFANFISGLIILFERPVRIGDTITLGNLHGTVSRIRIRATTVTDFDRKEIIIPNKTFVTDQLINWSLSDNITRVVLTYGVSHGSDLEQVHRLMRQAAEENQRVLREPEPQIFCLEYGATAFSFELRIFVNDLMDRLYASDEINRRLDALFHEHGIRIAFNQMDVWLHDASGRQAWVSSQPQADAPLGGEVSTSRPARRDGIEDADTGRGHGGDGTADSDE
ncbi:mechanosensitive channel MscK [Chromohalobacter moromii]|uniref:Mechanosensitive channel MscK n=1 Tax=Chromohalobacter moromii TaxID=2860329 RepID=A0A9X2X001_9GAMM|nr:mechanosensitive channel MscK [Chromohalobacter moromii]MCK2044856.1 mechanosensitive channel MscK [Chromohalobacter moromii]MCT8503991.1 mechanosensitive channel MscK [Chromohalobacter moromii]